MKKINTFLQYLTNIEHVFNESLYVKAEEYLDSNKLEILNSERHIFRLKFSGNPPHDLSIQLNSDKLSKHNCSCSEYKSDGICPHIVTAYLLVRKDLLLKNETPIQKTTTSTRQKNKPIRDILAQTSHEDIVSFISNIAKKDKKLSTAIRVHFLSQGKHVNAVSIKQILDSIISPIRNTDKKVSRTDWLLLFRTLEDFKGQTKDAITLSNFELAYNFIDTILNKLYYCLTKFESKENELKLMITEYTELCEEFFSSLEAPLRKEHYAKLLVAIVEKSYYKPYISFDFLHVILKQGLLDQGLKSKLAFIISEISLETEKELIHSLSLQLRLIISDKAATSELLQKINSPVERAVLKEINAEDDNLCLQQLMLHHKDYLDQTNYHELNVDVNLKLENYEEATKSLLILLKLNSRIAYYRQLKEMYPKHIDEKAISAARQIIAEWSATKQLEFHLIEEDYKELCQRLIIINEVDLCFEYDVQIPIKHADLIVDMYCAILKSYLDQHIGLNTNTFISKIFSHLNLLSSRKISDAIRKFLNVNYSERKSVKSLLDTYR